MTNFVNHFEEWENKVWELIHSQEFEDAQKKLDEIFRTMEKEYGIQSKFAGIFFLFTGILKRKRNDISALLDFNQSLKIMRNTLGRFDIRLLRCLKELGEIHKNNNNMIISEECYLEVIEIARVVFEENDLRLADYLTQLGLIYENQHKFGKAQSLHIESLKIYRANLKKDDERLLLAMDNLAIGCERLGKFDEAEQLYVELLENMRDAKMNQSEIFLQRLESLSSLYMNQEKFFEAEPLLQEEGMIKTEILSEKDPAIVIAYSKLGMLYLNLNNLTRAKFYGSNALIKLDDMGRDNFKHPEVLVNIARILKETQVEGSKSLMDLSVTVSRVQITDKFQLANVLESNAYDYFRLNEYESSKKLFLESLEIRKTKYRIEQVEILSLYCGLTLINQRMGNDKEAKAYGLDAVKVLQKNNIEFPKHLTPVLINLANSLIRLDKIKEGDFIYDKYESLLNNLNSKDEYYRDTLREISYNYFRIDEFEKGIRIFKNLIQLNRKHISQIAQFSSSNQVLDFVKTTHDDFFTFMTVLIENSSKSEEHLRLALETLYQFKAIAFEILLSTRKVLQDNNSLDHLDYDNLTSEYLARVINGWGSNTFEFHQGKIIHLSEDISYLESKIKREFVGNNLDLFSKFTLENIRKSIPPNTVLVEFFKLYKRDVKTLPRNITGSKYVAFVIHKDPNITLKIVDIGKAEEIDHNITQFREIIDECSIYGEKFSNENDRFFSSGMGLRKLIFDKLIPHLKDKTEIKIALDGNLFKIPFEILPTNNKEFLIDGNYNISYVGTGRDLLKSKKYEDTKIGSPVVICNPDFGAIENKFEEKIQPYSSHLYAYKITQLEKLPETNNEGKIISKIFQTQFLSNKDVLKEKIFQIKSPLFLHIATHGYFITDVNFQGMLGGPKIGVKGNGEYVLRGTQLVEDPLLRSGLIIANANHSLQSKIDPTDIENGFLTAEETVKINLQNTDLVVLSACDTGLGDETIGEGMTGLQRSFSIAGARSLIMSLWQVSDFHTSKLMESLYKNLSRGIPKNQALKEAQLEIKEKFKNPYFWGPFIYQGNTEPLPNLDRFVKR